MLIVGVKPGHDGGICAIDDGELVISIEAEKDSYQRHWALTPSSVLELASYVDAVPDVIAIGGWQGGGLILHRSVETGYSGVGPGSTSERTVRLFGRDVAIFSSTHERSHIAMALGMAPDRHSGPQAVLVWEGVVGSFYLIDEKFEVAATYPVMDGPGLRYAFLFHLAEPTRPDGPAGYHTVAGGPKLDDAGKLMALAAFGNADDADAGIERTVDRLLETTPFWSLSKADLVGSPVYNAGVTSPACTTAASLLSKRVFARFASVATRSLPAGLPLRVSGGCGLNCDWNSAWRELGHFSEVFVPPCANDSGSAIGSAIDAQRHLTGDPFIRWNVYSGTEFVTDMEPDDVSWRRQTMTERGVADALAAGRIVAWVQGRYEIGPRALGNRSLLAEPTLGSSRDRLNTIKQRESYRPIAPCCRVEDLPLVFDGAFEDPYMLYFRNVRADDLQAVTHVDGSARAQTVSGRSNPALHRLLDAVAARSGRGVLCNTSLNFNGYGFINRTSDLVAYCESREIDDMVVGRDWYQRRRPGVLAGHEVEG